MSRYKGLSDYVRNWINLGVKGHYAPWEMFLTRKLNYLAVVGFFNVLIALLVFLWLGEYQLIGECVGVLLLAPFVTIFNIRRNYVWGAYMFFLIGVVLLFFVTLKMGYQSFVVLFYFPLLISLVQLLGRKETLKHMIILSVMYFLSLLAIAWLSHYGFLLIGLSEASLEVIRPFNMLTSFFCAISLIAIVTLENIRQENLINRMLYEKEILMAEVFHRVKNNLNIVTSLLNLRKDASDSDEVRSALDDCRNRVFSMALVHQKIYSTSNVAQLNFSEYLRDLVGELVNTFGGEEVVDCRTDAETVALPLGDAIPCGLIINEVITNSFKYAQTTDRKLKITVRLQRKGAGKLLLEIGDNGPGFDYEAVGFGKSLGTELVRSLCEQLDAEFSYRSENGCVFRMELQR